MGAVQSKKHKFKKRHKSMDDESLYRDLERLRSLSKTRLNRLSADIENMTSDSSHEYSMCESIESTNTQTNRSVHNIPKYTKSVNLDDHPVLTKLQNKQNARLESMEQRMDRIRNSAMQAAERRKFAYMFKAKSEDNRKDELLKEATLALEKMKRQQRHGLVDCDVLNGDNDNDDIEDDGEIIPVTILRSDKSNIKPSQHIIHDDKNLLIGGLRLTDPITWFLLPLLLPIVLIVYIMRGICTNPLSPQIRKKSNDR